MAVGRLEFRILGPLTITVDGSPVPIGGPKQRALLAMLLLSANRVVSREQLVAELFPEQSVNAADHALRNHVSRLRKVLALAAADEPRLVARPPGYLLRVEPGELDFEHFERLVAAGRESLASRDAAAAAESLRAAERLWQGRPLADLELEPFARVEVDRLEELRLAAVEQRIDAELAAGRELALVPELEALSAEHPYRERFQAQLMLALYRSGRQTEGLEVYRRTRTLFADELGLDPGTELQALERAILVQDPALAGHGDDRAHATRLVRQLCPFKGLAPFEAADTEFFFGRERLVDELVARLADSPLLAIVGSSGSGKSSVLRAGLLPALGHRHLLLRPTDRAGSEIAAAIELVPRGERLVVAVDQLEELFAAGIDEGARREVVNALVDAAWDPERRAVLVVALRADFFGRLASYLELADLVGPNHVLLGPPTRGELRRAIEGPLERVGLGVEQALVDALVDDVAGEAGGLPLLQTALLDLWREREADSLTLAAYGLTGGVRGSVGRHAEAALRSFDDRERQVARRILLRLVDGGAGETALIRRRVTREELDADNDERIAHVLDTLVERRLLVANDDTVELVHEALLTQWPTLAAWVEEDAHGRRLHRHLTQAATGWEAAGLDSGELYRGVRLAAALEWAETSADDDRLNRLEQRFLAESRTAHARGNRRLRVLLAVALVLLLAALVAGAVALSARQTARDRATSAIAQRLGAQALVEPQLDRSLLLARAGVALDDSAATRSNLLAALLRSPAAIGVLHGSGERVLDEALSPDGRMLAIRSENGVVSFFDARSLREIPPRYRSSDQISYFGAIVRPVRSLAFSPDGRTLVVGDSTGELSTTDLVDARTHQARHSIVSAAGVVTADVAFLRGSRSLVTGEVVSGRVQPPDEVLVVRRASDGEQIRRSDPIAGGRLIGALPDGRLLVTSGETRSFLLEPRTFARLRAFAVGGTAALAPSGGLAAFGSDDGAIELVTLGTGRQRPFAGRVTGRVLALAFSPDGATLASGSDDGSLGIWDVKTRVLRETFAGHAGAARDLRFSPDGTTLYSGSDDGSVIVWDVSGRRRLGRPFRFAESQGAAKAVAVSPDGSLLATSPGAGQVNLRRARDGVVVARLRGPTSTVESVAFSHDGRLIAASGDGRRAVVWTVATGAIAASLGPLEQRGASGVNFSSDDRLLGTAGSDGLLQLFDLRTRQQVGATRVAGSLQDVDFSSDGQRVVAAGLSGDIAVYNLGLRQLERTINHHDGILAIRFAPDGRTIATGDIPGRVNFWDAATGAQVGSPLGGQNGLVFSVTFDASGKQVLTTSTDGKLRLWDFASRKLVGAALPGVDGAGWGTFFPDGKRVVAAFDSGYAIVWEIEPAAWATHACRVAGRNLTRAEWRDFLPERPYRPVCR